jgi:hypothetical protein
MPPGQNGGQTSKRKRLFPKSGLARFDRALYCMFARSLLNGRVCVSTGDNCYHISCSCQTLVTCSSLGVRLLSTHLDRPPGPRRRSGRRRAVARDGLLAAELRPQPPPTTAPLRRLHVEAVHRGIRSPNIRRPAAGRAALVVGGLDELVGAVKVGLEGGPGKAT